MDPEDADTMRQIKLDEMRAKKLKKTKREERRRKFKETVSPMSAYITEVHVDGLVKTDDELVRGIVKKLFEATNYGEVVVALKSVHRELKTLGCFDRVDVKLDSQDAVDGGGDPSSLQVRFKVVECGPVTWRLEGATTDENDAKLVWSNIVPNLLGRGESLRLNVSRSWNGNGAEELQFVSRTGHSSKIGPTTFLAQVARRKEWIPWRGLDLRQIEGAISVSLDPAWWVRQTVSLATSVRDVTANRRRDPEMPFTAREHCGYSTTASLSHTIVVDTRNDTVLPNSGLLAKWLSELAGPFGSSGEKCSFFKQDLLASVYLPISENLSLNLGSKLAFVGSMGSGGGVGIGAENYAWFRNPLQCRGWSNGKCGKKEFVLGAEDSQILFGASLKLVGRIPFLRTSSWIVKNTQAHLFCDFGSVGGLQEFGVRRLLRLSDWGQFSSLSAGLGLALKLGDFGRAELNYCVPVKNYSNCNFGGLQFGMGVNFM